MPVESELLAARLLAWYDAHARTLAWRVPPGDVRPADPYRVWLAEVMLQQTTVAAAGAYFEAFTQRWPTVEALAAAPDEAVMAAWAGLGDYARARNLLAAARAVAAGGGAFPRTAAELRRLPGVGAYTAAAVAAIAFGAREAVVDTNVMRVVARLSGDDAPPPALRDRAEAWLRPHVPAGRPGDFAQALMDLGATICTPRAPACLACPLRAGCAAHAQGRADALPSRAPRRVRPLRRGTLWWIESEGDVALTRRPPRGLLGGLLALPGTAWEDGLAWRLPFPGRWQRCPTPVRHGFTHFALELEVAAIRLGRPARPARLEDAALIWLPRAEIEGAGLPTLYARAVAAVSAWQEGAAPRPAREEA